MSKGHAVMLGALAALALTPAAAGAQGTDTTAAREGPELTVGMDAVSVWQALENQNDAGTLPNLVPGFQAALGNLHLNLALAEGIDVYAELYMSSKHHPGQVMDREGWVKISGLPERWDLFGVGPLFERVNVKAGHFEVDFGNQHLYRSDNAQVQRNPLIGNYVVDPNTVEAGVELMGREGAFYWVAGYGSGVTVEDFQPGKGHSLHAKAGLSPADTAFDVAASVYRADHSGNPTGYPNRGSAEELFSGNRSGSRYSGVINLGSPDAGQLNLGRGQDVLAWQLDGAWRTDALRLSGLLGRMRDADLNGSEPGEPREEWWYYGVEAKYNLLFDIVYVAGRYSGARVPTYRGAESDGRVDRFQAGLGYWLLQDAILFKFEYVNQKYRNFDQVFADNPRFSGILVEGSVSL